MDPERPDDDVESSPEAPKSPSDETFVRSFSKTHAGSGRVPGRSLHHPFEAARSDPPPPAAPRESRPKPYEKVEIETQAPEFQERDEEVEAAEPLTEEFSPEAPSSERLKDADSSSFDAPQPFAPERSDAVDRLAALQRLQKRRVLYRWIIRSFFLTAFIVVGLLVYRRVFGPQEGAAGGAESALVNTAANYRFRVPNKHWRLVRPRAGSDFTLSRENSAALLWIESGPAAGATPRGKLGDDMRALWQKEIGEMIEESTTTELVAGEVAQRIVASGAVGGKHVRRVGLTFSHQGLWYRIQYEAPVDASNDFQTVDDECRFAIGSFFRFLGARPGWGLADADAKRFHGVQYEYSLDRPPGEWRVAPELQADSRFADLKLFDPARSASIVISPRQDARIEQLHDLYVRRQQKRFENAVAFRDGERLEIGGQPALRIRAYVDSPDAGARVLVVTFIQGENIAYQIEAETPQENALAVLPDVAQAVESFQVGPAAPKAQPTPPPADAQKDSHFQKAPDWVQPK